MIQTVTIRSGKTAVKEDVVILPISRNPGKLGVLTQTLDRSCKDLVSHYLKKKMFEGDAGKTLLVAIKRQSAPSHLLLVGLGEPDKLTPERITDAAGSASKALSGNAFKSAAVLTTTVPPGTGDERFVRAFVKGFSLARYRYSLREKPAKPEALRRLVFLSNGDQKLLKQTAQSAHTVAGYIANARDMVNAPSNILTPSILADRAGEIAKEHGLSCRIVGPAEMKKQKMGAILGVGEGSREESRLIVMEYNRAKKKLPQVCLIGKGVTFDSGGISLKHWDRMNEMKGDMAGAAVVINTIAAASRLDIPVRIAAVIPAVENMPSGAAFKPGDIVTTYSGKTVEVLTTDAEGRLILADAITYSRKHFDPAVTIDIATLTGAVLIALGTRIAGILGNEQQNIDRIIAAGADTGEPVWQLPLDDHFRKSVKGDITDYKNYSGRDGSTITAAALLAEFAGDDPWIHVDIAGTFWSNGGGASYFSKGATGYGVDLIIEYLRAVAAAS